MENQTTTVDKVKEELKSFHAVETKVLQEVLDYMVKKPFAEVNDLLVRLHSATKTITISPNVPVESTAETVQ